VLIYSVLCLLVGVFFEAEALYDLPHKIATTFPYTFGLRKTQSSLNTKPK